MAKNETAYTDPSKPDTAFGAIAKPDTAHAGTAKAETGSLGTYPDGVTYNEPTVDYNSAIVNYNGSSKMNKEKTGFTALTKNETAYA